MQCLKFFTGQNQTLQRLLKLPNSVSGGCLSGDSNLFMDPANGVEQQGYMSWKGFAGKASVFGRGTSTGRDQPTNNHLPMLLSVDTRCRGVSGQVSAVWYISFLLCARAVNSWCHPWLKKLGLCRSNFYCLFQTLIVSPMGNNKVAQNYYSCTISYLMGRVHRKPSKPWWQTHLIESHILYWVYLGLSAGYETGEDLVARIGDALL